MTIRRRMAVRLMQHAGTVMPPGRAAWVDAMQAEFAAIPGETEALRWACGCVWAGYVERIHPKEVLRQSLLRATAVWLVIFGLFAITLMIAPQKYLAAFYLMQAARKLSICFAGLFLPLLVGEVLIARFWPSPQKIFGKSLVRAGLIWFPLLAWRLITLLQFAASHPDHQLAWARILWSNTLFFSILYAAIVVPLLLCELLIARPRPAIG